jgi:large exoprotein involved in heme utilization and adhesion
LNIADGAAIDSFTRGRGNAGNIQILAKDSLLLSNTLGGITSGVQSEGIGQGGNIQIQASLMTLANESSINSDMNGQGNGGSILIDVANLSVEQQGDPLPIQPTLLGNITTNLTGTGNAGGIKIQARDRISMDRGYVASAVIDGDTEESVVRGKGEGGIIQISSKDIYLKNSIISASLIGEGNAGSISITAGGLLYIDDKSNVSTSVSPLRTKGIGNAGKITLNAPSIFIVDRSVIDSSTSGVGNASNINITADKEVVVDGGTHRFAAISSAVLDEGVGQGGNITISTPSLSLLNGGFMLAGTIGVGDSGKVEIKANQMTLNQGNIFTSTGDKGNAGDIILNIDRISLSNSSSLSSVVEFDGKKLNGQGNGGNLRIKTKSLELSGGSQFNTSTNALGRAGDIQIQATESISLLGVDANNIRRSGIFSIVGSTGKDRGGNIKITTGTLNITDDASVSASG